MPRATQRGNDVVPKLWGWSRESNFDLLQNMANELKAYKSLHQKFPKRSWMSCLSSSDSVEELKRIKEVNEILIFLWITNYTGCIIG